MSSCVVVIRLNSGDNLLAILDAKLDHGVKVEHPHFVMFNSASSNLQMVPYCPLSDETFFEIDKKNINFLVTASSEISTKFLNLIDSIEQIRTAEIVDNESYYDKLGALIEQKNYVDGNNTRH